MLGTSDTLDHRIKRFILFHNRHSLTNTCNMGKKLRQHAAPLKRLLFLFSLSLFSCAAFTQIITGTVTDSASNPVSKATVHVKGTSRTTATDDAGKFTINASANDVLVLTSVGFLRQEVPVSGRRSLNITMAADIHN